MITTSVLFPPLNRIFAGLNLERLFFHDQIIDPDGDRINIAECFQRCEGITMCKAWEGCMIMHCF